MDSLTNDEEFVAAINELFNEKIPFNKTLGLNVESITADQVSISIQMRDDLMGQFDRGMLHGGAISSVIDVAGGLCAFIGLQHKIRGETLEDRINRFSRVSTIDIRVDFLRPGLGKWFVATAYVLRTGKRIAVTRIELHNDQNQLIAAGTGSYSVG